MTIAACYVSNEGVVLGADSTSTFTTPTGLVRHYNNEQKLFEVGEMGSSLGLVTWGLGGLPTMSYRLLVAELSDSLVGKAHCSRMRRAVAGSLLATLYHRNGTNHRAFEGTRVDSASDT